ncbi:MAG: acetyl-CoA carboxylase biotin carboxyl carrier protein [Flavobacteriia bacterium]|nr:acetyl-CoA carboxylase biotin carboxyl carrier protein [Flavobacteriia bacterium]NDA27575.1 acetyl-CoA carboxylase biotin carboxyl carrier protein [Flavobacteriia bacterium]NDD19840.1 acetyl-CoA carboxylase biotin carboxyl carrier protein [Flavobacteriia bacterium]
MDFKELQNFIKFVTKSGASEVSLETDNFKVTVKTSGAEGVSYVTAAPAVMAASMPAAPAATAAAAAAPVIEDEFADCVAIKSPMIGTFYLKPSPDKPAFKSVGDTVKAGETVCIIEAMKLFNEIESEVTGKIVKIVANDMTPVEYGQTLFLVEPA